MGWDCGGCGYPVCDLFAIGIALRILAYGWQACLL
ncbi:(Fe-S)-binding protein [Ktedonospora formicarum]